LVAIVDGKELRPSDPIPQGKTINFARGVGRARRSR
jgi:hypothetical protein